MTFHLIEPIVHFLKKDKEEEEKLKSARLRLLELETQLVKRDVALPKSNND